MSKNNELAASLIGGPLAIAIATAFSIGFAAWYAVPASMIWNYHVAPVLGMRGATWQFVAVLLLLRAAIRGVPWPQDYAKRKVEFSERLIQAFVKLSSPWLFYLCVRVLS